MTIGELIKELQRFDQDVAVDVCFNETDNNGFTQAHAITEVDEDDLGVIIYIETEAKND